MTNWRSKIKDSTLPESTVKLVMMGDRMAEHQRLTAELATLEGKSAGSLAGSPRKVVQDQLDALLEEMRDSIIEVRLRALPRSRRAGDSRMTWPELADAHPPRVDGEGVMDPRDRLNGGINSATMPEVLVRQCIISVDGDESELTDGDWNSLASSLSEGQFQELLNECWSINRNTVNVPFLLAGSKRTGTTDAE